MRQSSWGNPLKPKSFLSQETSPSVTLSMPTQVNHTPEGSVGSPPLPTHWLTGWRTLSMRPESLSRRGSISGGHCPASSPRWSFTPRSGFLQGRIGLRAGREHFVMVPRAQLHELSLRFIRSSLPEEAAGTRRGSGTEDGESARKTQLCILASLWPPLGLGFLRGKTSGA